MFEVHETATYRFDARLRGVGVTCTVAFDDEGHPEVSIAASAANLEVGLRDISKFAGYCQRTLVLESSSPEADAWARVLASYFGFGLIMMSDGARSEAMPPPGTHALGDDGPRRTFVRRVIAHLSRD